MVRRRRIFGTEKDISKRLPRADQHLVQCTVRADCLHVGGSASLLHGNGIELLVVGNHEMQMEKRHESLVLDYEEKYELD